MRGCQQLARARINNYHPRLSSCFRLLFRAKGELVAAARASPISAMSNFSCAAEGVSSGLKLHRLLPSTRRPIARRAITTMTRDRAWHADQTSTHTKSQDGEMSRGTERTSSASFHALINKFVPARTGSQPAAANRQTHARARSGSRAIDLVFNFSLGALDAQRCASV